MKRHLLKLLIVLLAAIALPVFGQGWTQMGSPLTKILGNNDTGIICGEVPGFSSGWGEDMTLRTNCLYSDANTLPPNNNVELWWTVVTNCPTIQHNPRDMIYTTYWSPLNSPGLWTALASVTNNFIETNWLSTRIASDYSWLTNGYYTTIALETDYVSGANSTWQYTTNCIGCQTPSTNATWVKDIGSTGYERGICVSADSAGNIYNSGLFIGTVNFGPATLTSVGTYDTYVAKYNSIGTCLWAVRFGGSGVGASPVSISCDNNGSVAIAGMLSGNEGTSIVFGGTTLTNGPHQNFFMAKLSASDGSVSWAREIGNANYDCFLYAMKANTNNGNIVLGGKFTGAVNFGEGNSLSSWYGGADAYLATYSTAGSCLWASNFNNISDIDAVSDIDIAPSGNILIAGQFTAFINFGCGDLNDTSFPIAGSCGFIAVLNTNGGCLMSRKFQSIIVNRAAFDNSENVLVGGSFNNMTAQFGATNIYSPSTVMFLAKYNSVGTNLWAFKAGSPGGLNSVTGICCDTNNNVAVAGIFSFTGNYGGADLETGSPVGQIFVAEWNSSGQHQWSYQCGGSGSDAPGNIAFDPANYLLGTGYFLYSSTFFNNTTIIVSQGGLDAFLFRQKF